MTKTYDSGAGMVTARRRLRPITNPKGVYQMSLLDRIVATIVYFWNFVRMIEWSSDVSVGLVAVSHPKFKPWTKWTLLPYRVYIRVWALRVCWLNAKQSHMYAWDYFLMMNYWEY